jgi:hypothetical protein
VKKRGWNGGWQANSRVKLETFIDLSLGLFDKTSVRDLERCRQRAAVEAPHELRRYPDAARITWLAGFVYLRARSLTDDLVDLLIGRFDPIAHAVILVF